MRNTNSDYDATKAETNILNGTKIRLKIKGKKNVRNQGRTPEGLVTSYKLLVRRERAREEYMKMKSVTAHRGCLEGIFTFEEFHRTPFLLCELQLVTLLD